MNIFDNPFFILSASTRDNSRKIIELANNKSLLFDSDKCLQARNDLTNPRRRLAAEISWFPGVSPKKIDDIITYFSELKDIGKASSMDAMQFEGIARLTFSINQLKYKKHNDISDIGIDILNINNIIEKIDIEKILLLLNEERTVSGFPKIDGPSQIEDELRNIRSEIREVVNQVIGDLTQEEYIRLANMVAQKCYTEESLYEDGVVVEDALNSYQLNIKDTLDVGMQQIITLGERIINDVATVDLDSLIEDLIKQVEHWDLLVQPLQLVARYKGTKHNDSEKLANFIRNLAIKLNNYHYATDQSIKLIRMMQNVFAELPELAEIIEEDNEALERIKTDQMEQEKENQEMLRHNKEDKTYSITLCTSKVAVPPLCTCCMEPTSSSEKVSSSNTQTGFLKDTTSTVSLDFPICDECKEHRKAISSKKNLIIILSLVVSIASIPVWYTLKLDSVWCNILPFILSLLIYVLLGKIIKLPILAPSHSTNELSVWISGFSMSEDIITFTFTNWRYANLFASVNQAPIGETQRRSRIKTPSFIESIDHPVSVMVGILVILLVVVLFLGEPLSSLGGKSVTTKPNSATTTTKPNNTNTTNYGNFGSQTKQQKLDSIKNDLDSRKVRINSMESRLESLSSDLDYYERMYYSTGNDMYKNLYNSMNEDYQSLYNQYDKAISDYNKLVAEYNNNL